MCVTVCTLLAESLRSFLPISDLSRKSKETLFSQGRQLDAVTTSKFTERSWQLKRLQLTAVKEQFKLELRPSSEQEKCFEGIPSRPKGI